MAAGAVHSTTLCPSRFCFLEMRSRRKERGQLQEPRRLFLWWSSSVSFLLLSSWECFVVRVYSIRGLDTWKYRDDKKETSFPKWVLTEFNRLMDCQAIFFLLTFFHTFLFVLSIVIIDNAHLHLLAKNGGCRCVSAGLRVWNYAGLPMGVSGQAGIILLQQFFACSCCFPS